MFSTVSRRSGSCPCCADHSLVYEPVFYIKTTALSSGYTGFLKKETLYIFCCNSSLKVLSRVIVALSSFLVIYLFFSLLLFFIKEASMLGE